MNNVKDLPVDEEEMRLWAIGYKEMHGLSWPKLAAEIGVKSGTLQPFCKGNYGAPGDWIARDIYRFMQTVEARESTQKSIPEDPGYFETPTSLRIRSSLIVAHSGRMTLVGTGPGTGKDMTVNDYKDRASHVYCATMMASCARIGSMCQQVQQALKLSVKYGHSVSSASRAIIEHLRDRRALLVINEAQHLDLLSFEEIRAWHDETGVGICLMGNAELLARIESGRQSDGFARLNSRLADKFIRPMPLKEDVVAFCDAWRIADPAIRHYLERIALEKGSGALRECRMLIEAGSMIAESDQRGLTISDLRDAQSQRATRWIKA